MRRSREELNRRGFLSLAGGSLLFACTRNEAQPLISPPPGAALGSVPTNHLPSLAFGTRGPIELYSWFDLPTDDSRSRELSGLAWDAKTNTLFAVQDDSPYIIRLVPDSPKLKTWSFGESIKVSCDFTLDLEGLVILPDGDGFLIASEAGPRVFEVDRNGHHRRDVTIPERFRDSRTNRSLESLTMSPSGRYLFTTSEVALTHDGPSATTEAGTRVRIACMERGNGGRSLLYNGEASEHVYETDPVPTEGSDWGVADLAALSDTELLVLERGWKRGYGNTIRIYQVSLNASCSCLGKDDLAALTPLPKTLRVDIGKLDVPGLPVAKQPQPNAILDNYEGITLGPRLPDGRQSLILISDDNGHANQVARVLVLAL